MNLRLVRVTADNFETLKNLMQLYLYDFSEFLCDEEEGQVDEQGQFDPGFDLSRYVDRAGFVGYLARLDGQWAGFALISERADQAHHTGPGRAVDEFFVMRCFRRRGVGEQLARLMFDTYRGYWQVTEIGPNQPAQAFWKKVVGRYTGDRYEAFETEEFGFKVVWQTFDSSA